MIVKDWMTENVITVKPETNLYEAIQLLKDRGFRRLPVVKGEKLVGIVTDRDLKQASPSGATTLSIYELNYLLARLTVGDVMAKPVYCVSPDDPIEKAATMMREYKISGLPVVKGNKVVGILTITDVLGAFIDSQEQAIELPTETLGAEEAVVIK